MLTADSWARALRFLALPFAQVIAHTSADWRVDVLTVMARKAADPLGWAAHNSMAKLAHDGSLDHTCNFFAPTSAERLEDLNLVSRESACQLLVLMQADFFRPNDVPGLEQHRQEYPTQASTVLSCFGPDPLLLTNATIPPEDDPYPDFFVESQPSTASPWSSPTWAWWSSPTPRSVSSGASPSTEEDRCRRAAGRGTGADAAGSQFTTASQEPPPGRACDAGPRGAG